MYGFYYQNQIIEGSTIKQALVNIYKYQMSQDLTGKKT